MVEQSLTYFARLPEKEALSVLKSSLSGLPNHEVEKRLRIYGANTLTLDKRKNIFIEFFTNFKNPLVLILICVAFISLFLGQTVNSLIVALMVVLSVCLNFFQEHSANKAAEKLKARVAPRAVVIRDGKAVEVLASKIVPGDILVLNAGDLVPADARIIDSKDLFVNQSALTGESFPVDKYSKSVKAYNSDITGLMNFVYAGTSVVTGTAHAVIVKTGISTQFGGIAKNLMQEKNENEFTIGIRDFSKFILRIIIVFVLFIFFANAFIKHDVIQSLTFAIAVTVGLTPELLPMIMTVTMSRGSMNMAKKGVIVKKLTAIPTYGSMDILCTDKTGTLTEDHIHLIKYIDLKGMESESVFKYAYLNSYFQTGITNPMDKAVTDFKKEDISSFRKLDEIPFDFERKRMTVVVDSGKNHLLITKGAPEEVLRASNNLDKIEQKKFITTYHDLSKEGYRVLAIAIKELPHLKKEYTKFDEREMSTIGFIAFLDPPRTGVKSSIDELEAMGIEMKVLTGDNEFVTQKICKDININVKGTLLGHEIEGMKDEELYEKAINTTIFARFSPIQKNKIISVLRTHGRVVGFMGDGINDAPSLKAADVGISVSNGVDVAKESADIILTNKSLHELRNGVIEGRKTFGNTIKYITMGLSSNFGNMFSVLGAVLFLPFLPMLPIQILLNNFLYDLGQISIPLDNVDDEFVQKPKRWNVRHIRNYMLFIGPISSIFDFITFFVLFIFFKNAPGSFQTGWFMESLATQTLVIHIIRTRKLPFIQSTASPFLWLTTILVVIVGWIIPITGVGKVFGFSVLPVHIIFTLIAIVAFYLISTEIGKRLFYSSRFSEDI
jgi:Mg2+-importing ATPase